MRHVSVLADEVISGLALQSGYRVVDCTLGDGGHAERIIERVGPTGRILGIDADPESLLRAKQYLYNLSDQTIFVRDKFYNLTKILAENNFTPVDAILADLGWSSPQFEERGRGFSHQKTEPLDMRYGGALASTDTAADILARYSEDELYKILKNYGEEKFAKEIATAIVSTRENDPVQTTADLNEIVLRVYRERLRSKNEIPWVGGAHPATQTYQALRVAVNDELGALKKFLPAAVEALKPGGRLAVISFHSLEDRIVKQFFSKNNNHTIRLVNKKPIVSAEAELSQNSRAHSAKLRIIEKI